MWNRKWLGLLALAGATLLAMPARGEAQATGRIAGTVLNEAGQPVSGASVLVTGTRLSAVSGEQGRYSISDVPAGQHTVRVTMLGYGVATQAVTVTASGSTTANFTLNVEAVELEALVAVGYATQRARSLTGSVTTVTADRLNSVATMSVNQMLEGRAPGLIMTTRSAQPGGGVSVSIRGAISPRGNNTPLYVIDGVPVTEFSSSVPGLVSTDLGFYGGIDRDPLSSMNPNDIESVTVLRDASASAIYGSAAANGVVLITTKVGRPGNIAIDYRGSYSTERPQDYFPMLNAQEFMGEQNRLAQERWRYDNKIAPYGTKDPSTVTPFAPLFTESQINAGGAGTDWFGMLLRDGQAQEHNLSLSGGSANTSAYASFNYRAQDAVLRNSSLNRYGGRINLRQAFTDRITLNVNAAASRLVGDNASTGNNSGGPEKFNMLQAARSYAPTVPVYDDVGEYSYSYNRLVMNPAAFLSISDHGQTSSLAVTPNLEIGLSAALKVNVTGQIDQQSTTRSFYLPRTTNNVQAPDGMAQKAEAQVDNYSTEAYATYQTQLGASAFTVVGGGGYYTAGTEGTSVQGMGFFTDAFGANNLSVANNLLKNAISSYKTSRTKLSQFGRLNYSLHDRYILALVVRRDGSSIFSEDHKWGIFPGVSAAWIASDETFVRDRVPQLSQLKLRLGYGEAGNESVLAGNTLQLYNPGYTFLIGSTLHNGVALSQVANPELRWETVTTVNAGLDVGLWNQRVSASFDYYVKTARDLLDYNPLPANNAVGRVADNVGSTRSRGFEVALRTTNIDREKLRWNTDFNVSNYYGYWVERNPLVPQASYIGEQDAIDAIYGWETDGIIQQEADRPDYMPLAPLGTVRYVDQNGDGELNSDDVVILGNSRARWMVGFSNTVVVGPFDVSAHVYGNLQYRRGDNFAPATFSISQLTNPENTTVLAKDIWSSTNPTGTLPGVAADAYSGRNPAGTDFNLRSAGFLRLRNVSIGYALPRSLFGSRSTLRTARAFVDFQNLGVFTDYPGFDPEYTENNPYPKAATITFGVQVGL